MKLNIKQGLIKLGLIQDPEVKAPPLTAQRAYEIFAGEGRKNPPSLESLYKEYLEDKLKDFEITSRTYHNTYYLIELPDWFDSKLRDKLIEDLTALKFRIGYSDNKIILVLWG